MDIEDILNGSDDDDEDVMTSSSVHPSTNFDVDALLDESDSDEESIQYSFRGEGNTKRPTAASAGVYQDTRSQRNDVLEALLDLPVGDMDMSLQDTHHLSSSPPTTSISSSSTTKGQYKGVFEDSTELSWKLSTQQRSGEFQDDDTDQLFSIDKMPISLESAYRHELLSQSSGHRKFSSLLVDSSASMSGLKAGSLTEISSQLSKNAQFKNHGPGKATALYVSKSYFVIGTSRGIILMFDNQEELRNVISVHATTNSSSSSSATSTSIAGITSIDFHEETSLLICGFDNGNISLIDTKKSTLLKGIIDVHTSSIIKVRICRSEKISLDMVAVSVDKNGMVYRFHFKKTLWGLNSDKTCLLDGSAGMIYDLSVLKYSSASKDTGNRGVFNDLIAFNSSTRTYIVQMAPKIEVIYRWILFDEGGRENTAVDSANKTIDSNITESCAISLQWNKYNSSQADASPQYLLRSYSSKIEILCCPAAKRPGNYSFYVAASQTYPEKSIVYSFCMVDKIAILFQNEIFITDFQFNIICQHQLQHSFHYPVQTSGSNAIISMPDIVVSRDSCIYLLSKENLRSYDMMSASSQLEKLIQSDNWLPALSLAMKLYTDPSKLPNLDLKDYVQRYCKTFLKSNSLAMQSVQPIFIAEVCIEFCINCGLEEFMFQDVYELFVSFDMQASFLQAIESAILNKVVRVVPLKVLKDLLAASIKNSRTYVFENCVIQLNLQNVVTLAFTEVLLNQSMFSAYLYCCSYNNISPQNALADLFNFVYTAAEDIKPVILDKIMLYILFTSERKRFPSGENINISTNDIHGVLTMAVSSVSLGESCSNIDSSDSSDDIMSKNQSILSTLWDHDSASLLFCLRKGIDVLLSQGKTAHVRILYSLFAHVSGLDLDMTSSGIGSNRKHFLDAFIEIVVECSLEMPYSSMHATSSALTSTSSISFEMIHCVLIYLSSYQPRSKADFLARRLAISQSQLESEKDKQVSEAFRSKKFWRALLIVDKEISEDVFREALQHYISYKTDEKYKNQVFDFLEEVTSAEDSSSHMDIPVYIYDTISRFLEAFAILNAEKTLALAQLFSHAPLNIFKNLFKLFPEDSRSRFLFLESCFKSIEAEVEIKEIVTDPAIMLGYFELLAEFDPNGCLPLLIKCGYTSSCRDRIFDIASKSRIYDVQVHILERENNVDAALETLTKEMKDSLLGLKTASVVIVENDKKMSVDDNYDNENKSADLVTMRSCDSVLSSICRLCSSNGGNTGGGVWFAALNSFLQIKEEVGKSQEVKEVIDNSLRVLITLMSNQVQSSDIVRHITARDFSAQQNGNAYDLSTLFHTMKESLEQDHYIAKIILNIYTHDMHDVFSRKIDKTKSAILVDPTNKTQEEILKSLYNQFSGISNGRNQKFLQRKSLKSMNSCKMNGMDLSPKAQLDMNALSVPISLKREPKSLPSGAKFTASL